MPVILALDEQVNPAQLQFVLCWAVVNRSAVLRIEPSNYEPLERNAQECELAASICVWKEMGLEKAAISSYVHVHVHVGSQFLLIKEAVQ